MNDDEIIETFLKENDAELSRLSFRRKLMMVFRGMAIAAPLFFFVLFIVRLGIAYYDHRAAAQKVIDDEKAAADERAQKIEDARLLEKRHRENQYAYIMVQYAADGHAVGCWVT